MARVGEVTPPAPSRKGRGARLRTPLPLREGMGEGGNTLSVRMRSRLGTSGHLYGFNLAGAAAGSGLRGAGGGEFAVECGERRGAGGDERLHEVRVGRAEGGIF